MKIEDMNMPQSIKVALKLARHYEIEELIDFSDDELKHIPYICDEDVPELRKAINQFTFLEKYSELIDARQYTEAMAALENAVDNGFSGDYSILADYYTIGINGEGGGQWDKALIWLSKFYSDYFSGKLHIGNNAFHRARVEYLLGFLNYYLADTIGNCIEADKHICEYIKYFDPKDEDTLVSLSTICMMMLGAHMTIQGKAVEIRYNATTAMKALAKDRFLGNDIARKIISHIARDGYDLHNPQAWFNRDSTKQGLYLRAICIYYGYFPQGEGLSLESSLIELYGRHFDSARYFADNRLRTEPDGSTVNLFVEYIDPSIFDRMRLNARNINELLIAYHVDAHVINVVRGIGFISYEVELSRGVRLNKIISLEDEFALHLGSPYVKIAPISGKAMVVGITIPDRIYE